MTSRLRPAIAIVLITLLLQSLGAGVQAQAVPVWFRADFDNLGAGLYNFANRYAQSPTTWTTEHRPTGGWRGSGAPHVVVKGCTAATGRPCNTSENQFNIGWVTPALTNRVGISEFIRFRIRFDPDTFFGVAGRQFGAKFILHGTRGSDRWIIHLYPPYENNGCTLGFEGYGIGGMGWTPPAGQWWRARQDWGLSGEWRDAPQANRYAGFTPNVNISWSCAPGVLVASSNHPQPVPKPQFNGAASTDGWYHLQFQAIPGAAGGSGMRVWSNNNSQNAPSSERLNMPEALTTVALTDGVYVGGYWGMAQPQDIGFVIDDFEIGGTFDPNWYPGSGPAPSTPPTPAGFRITTSN